MLQSELKYIWRASIREYTDGTRCWAAHRSKPGRGRRPSRATVEELAIEYEPRPFLINQARRFDTSAPVNTDATTPVCRGTHDALEEVTPRDTRGSACHRVRPVLGRARREPARGPPGRVAGISNRAIAAELVELAVACVPRRGCADRSHRRPLARRHIEPDRDGAAHSSNHRMVGANDALDLGGRTVRRPQDARPQGSAARARSH